MALDLAHTDAGSGDPVVILHGLFGSKRNWGAIAKALCASHRVLCLDLRNHGESPWDDVMTYEAMAEDVARFIRRHGLGPVSLVGHSMGGKAAMTLALGHPELVARLVVVDIAPAPSPGSFADYVEALQSMDLGRVATRRDADALLVPHEPNASIRAFLLQNLESARDGEGGGFRWRPNLAALSANMGDILDFPAFPHGHSYRGPGLFLAGGASDYIGPHHHGEIARLFPTARVDILPGVGHWVHAQAPDLFLGHLRQFLSA